MAGGNKAGLAGGVVVALGLGLARFGDDCARGGVRGARALDDVAGGAASGRMAVWGPEGAVRVTADDAARTGLGADGAARLGARVDGAALPGVRGAALGDDVLGAGVGEGPWWKAARDLGSDVGVELVRADLGGELPAVLTEPGQVRCPRRVEVTRSPAAWDELLGGFGVACAPVVVVGTASPDAKALRVGARDVPLLELAKACADAGARCVLVGCPAARADACVAASAQSLRDNPLQPSLRPYVRGFVAQALSQAVAPVVIAELAVVDGTATLVLASPGAGEP
jgi:hypothetical protein